MNQGNPDCRLMQCCLFSGKLRAGISGVSSDFKGRAFVPLRKTDKENRKDPKLDCNTSTQDSGSVAPCGQWEQRNHNQCIAFQIIQTCKGGINMLKWAGVFFIIAIIAAFFGFVGIAGAAIEIAKVLFYIFVILFIITLVAGLIAGRRVSR